MKRVFKELIKELIFMIKLVKKSLVKMGVILLDF